MNLMNLVDAFGNEQGSKNRLLNILMNLRKCVDHPYLFDGELCSGKADGALHPTDVL